MRPLSLNSQATRCQLQHWSTFSRNAVRPLLSNLGVEPLRKKYPMMRVYEGLLGMTPSNMSEEEMLSTGLMRLGEAADRLHIGSETLLEDLRNGENTFPPLFVFGPRRHLFLRAQIEQMMSSPRNAWHQIQFVRGHSVQKSCLATMLNVTPPKLNTILENKKDPPAHIISGGIRRYLVADIACRLGKRRASHADAQSNSVSLPVTTSNKGLFAQVTHAAAASVPPTARTASASNAQGGDISHGKSAEAKLSET